jgi:predicted component of type VI protein secretion system
VLERPREPVTAAPVRRPARHVLITERDRPAVGPVEAAQDVDESRLAGTVRADQADHLAPVEVEVHPVERLDSLERTRNGGGPE